LIYQGFRFIQQTLYNCTSQELFVKAIQQMAKSEIDNYPLLGGWEKEAEMVDQILDDIISNRGRI